MKKIEKLIREKAKWIAQDHTISIIDLVIKFQNKKINFTEYKKLLKAYEEKTKAEIEVLVANSIEFALKS